MIENLQKKKLIFLLILAQTMLAVSGGLLGLYLSNHNRIPYDTYVNDINIGGLYRNEAEKKVEEGFKNIKADQTITISCDKEEVYKIKLADINAVPDAKATIDKILGEKIYKRLIALIDPKFSSKKRVFPIQFALDEGKLNEKFIELSELVNKESVDADICVMNGKIVKVPEAAGCKLNVINASKKFEEEMGLHLNSPIDFDVSNNFEIGGIPTRYTLRNFDGIDEVISGYSTDITSDGLLKSIRLASGAIHKVLLYPKDKLKGKQENEFSFNKCLSIKAGLSNKNNEGFNQVASTLYAAVLSAGISEDSITRTPDETMADYIESGLDARVSGNSVDFKFKNTLDDPIMIISQVKGNKIIINIAGKKKDKNTNYQLSTDVVQKYDPPVISVANKDLNKGEKKLISSGKQGAKVNVYMITTKSNSEIDKKLLHTDTYRPIETIIQTGPNTMWENDSVK